MLIPNRKFLFGTRVPAVAESEGVADGGPAQVLIAGMLARC